MLIHIPNLISEATLDALRPDLARLDFVDGRATAGWHARGVKDNHQAAASADLQRVQTALLAALEANEVFCGLAFPARIAPPIVSRTGEGQGGYGRHVDDPVMGARHPLRTDISVTIFLNPPESYDGGELVVESLAGEDSAKFAAGDAVIYPATTLHRVEPVTRGERLVAVTWVQSRIRDAAKREVLIDLDRARRLVFAESGKSEAFDLVAKTYANLIRRWAEV